jgi:hypothetical protein
MTLMNVAKIVSPISLWDWLGVLLAVLLWLGVAFLLWRRRKMSLTPHPVRAAVAITCACLCSAVVLAALLTNHRPILIELTNQSWFIAPTIAVAIIAFFAKMKYGLAYGALEIIVAVLTFWFSIRAHNDSLLVKGLGLSGGVYIFVRGSETIRNSLRRT